MPTVNATKTPPETNGGGATETVRCRACNDTLKDSRGRPCYPCQQQGRIKAVKPTNPTLFD